jgi:zinc transporter 1/2/3
MADTWANIPSHILRSELARRANETTTRPTCGGNQTTKYNTTIHVIALIIVLVVSTGCKFPPNVGEVAY